MHMLNKSICSNIASWKSEMKETTELPLSALHGIDAFYPFDEGKCCAAYYFSIMAQLDPPICILKFHFHVKPFFMLLVVEYYFLKSGGFHNEPNIGRFHRFLKQAFCRLFYVFNAIHSEFSTKTCKFIHSTFNLLYNLTFWLVWSCRVVLFLQIMQTFVHWFFNTYVFVSFFMILECGLILIFHFLYLFLVSIYRLGLFFLPSMSIQAWLFLFFIIYTAIEWLSHLAAWLTAV